MRVSPARLTAGCLAARLPVNERTDAVSTLLAGGRTAVGCGGRSRTRIFLVNSQAHYHAFACATPQCGTQIVKDQRGFPLRWCVRVSNPAGPRAAWVTATPVSLSVYRTMLYVRVLNVQSPDFLSAPATFSTLVLLHLRLSFSGSVRSTEVAPITVRGYPSRRHIATA